MNLTTAVIVVVGLGAGVWFTAALRTIQPAAPTAGRLSVIVPARNEAARLPGLLRSLSPIPPDVDVLVVDDGSTDGTADVAHRFGARVVTAPTPPAGWLGKPWACWTGAEEAGGAVLVFFDADVELGPGALDALVAAHGALAPDGLLSVQPHHRTERAFEQASAVPNVLSMLGSGCFAPGRRHDGSVAFGPCLVTTAEAYRAVGGHGAVAGEVIEDLHLARAYRAAGRSVRCLAGGPIVGFRMYPEGVRSLVEGWTKNLAGGVRLAPRPAALAGVAWVTAGLAIALEVLRQVAHWSGPGPDDLALAVAWIAYAGHLRSVLRRIGSFRWWTAWLFPLALLAFLALFAGSVVLRAGRRRVAWRGRTISLGRAGG